MADEIRLDVSANTTPMERDIADARRRVGTIRLNANMDSRGMENFNRSLGKITGQADEFSKSMEAANARVLAFGASVGVINAISNAFKNLVSSTVEVEKSLTEIKIVGNETFKDLNATSAGLFNIAKQLGVSYKDAADSTLEFARQGKGLTESLDASRAALALTRTAGIAAADAVMGLTSAVNAFGRGADAYIEYANKMSSVSDAFAVNNKDLIEGISRSASVAQEAGVSFEELTALITSLQQTTGRGGAVIGNALKTIFTRVQNPEIIKDLRDLGISVQDATTGSFLPATQIIQNLANEFEGFDKNLRNSVLLKVGGGFQVDKLAAVLNDVKDASGIYQRSLNMAMSGSGDILGRVSKLNQTIDSSFTNLLTSSKQLGSNIGLIAFSKDFTDVLNMGTSAITSINEAIFGNGGKDAEDQGSSIGKAVLKGIGSIVSGPGLALFIGILGKLSLDFAKFSTSGLQALLGITSKSKEEQLIQTAITNVLSRNANFQQEIFNLEGNRVAQAELLLGVIRQQVNESKKLQEVTSGIAPILQQRGVRLSGAQPQILGSAKGFIPNLAGAIAKERSESPAGSRIIVDNNFPMGGGKRSTMVYNSNETRIPNFRGSGGDAIIPNYPINSAKGYTPNFAQPQKDVLNIDARTASVAGITFAGEGNGVLDKAKPYPLTPKNLEKYAGSNFLDTLQEYKNFNVINLPVGNAYRFRKGLQGSEDQIKSDFISKLNSKFRSEIVNFLLQEVSDIGLKPGAGLASNLSNIKLDVIGTSTAGYLFEELLKIPTLTDAEKVAQYSSQSSTEAFDVKNLEPSFAEAYGLPKQKFSYVEIKLGQKQLKDDISRKLLNQTVLEGGGANPAKFGVVKRAASGYIPNFAQSIGSLKSRMAGGKQKGSGYLQNYYDINNEGFNDYYDDNVNIKKYSLDKTLNQYTNQAQQELSSVRSAKKYDSFRNKLGKYLGSSFKYEKMFDESKDSTSGTLNNIKGALAEKDFQQKFKDFTRETNEKAGIDFYKGNELIEIKARKKQFSKEEANAKALAFLGSKSNYKNKTNENISLSSVNFSLYETYKNANKDQYLNAAKGYIPNFSELTGSGSGMMYQDPLYKELGGGQSGKFLAPKSGEGFGQKIFYKQGSEKIGQEYHVNKSIKDFEKENPPLFAKNAIAFTNIGKILTKNGLAAGFEREVIGGLGVDEFATGKFPSKKTGSVSPKADFAFYLSELLAQTGVKNVVGEYGKKYGTNSLRIDDIYAQNFKLNDAMQSSIIGETNQFFTKNKGFSSDDVYKYINSLKGNPLLNSLNEKFGSAGARHTMFDTQGFSANATSASKGYIPNFAKMDADLLTVNPAIAKLSVDQFIEKYLGSEYSTGLSGTSGNVLKISGNPQQMAEAKRDFIMSMLGPNFLATYDRSEQSNRSRRALISQKSTSTGTRVKKEGGYLRASGKYAQTDLSAALEGTFSGNAKRINYEDLDTKAEKIFEQSNLTQYWNEIVKTMQLVGNAYTTEVVSASSVGEKPNFDYNTVEVPEEGKFKYGLQETYRAKDKIKQLTSLIRPKLIQGLLEGEEGVQGLVLNQPEYDKETSIKGDYFVLLDTKAAQLKKLVSDYLINPDLDPLQAGTPELSENKFRVKELLNSLDTQFGSEGGRGGLLLDELKRFREYSKGNPQLQKFFMDGEDRPGAFLVKKMIDSRTGQSGNRLGAFLKPELPQSIIERMATVLAAVHNRGGIFPLSNLDVGYAGQLSYAGSKNNPLIDTFATSPPLTGQSSTASISNQPSASAASIPSTIKYGDYKNNKAYYDSIGKWKYDPASKSMARQASKGYIPNFAGGGIIDSLKNKAKKIIKSPITQTLFDQLIQELFRLPEGFESSEMIKQMNVALASTEPQRNLAEINRKKKSEKRQERRRDYLSRNAYDGYTPNFASSIQDAIVREKAATGLPDSMIKVSKDSRARNSSLNPTGFIVTNKVDEPRGGIDVPNSRMVNAYNSSRGFIPNFSTTPPGIAADAFVATASGNAQVVNTMNTAQANSGMGTASIPNTAAAATATTAVTTAQKKLSDQILEYVKSLGLSSGSQDKVSKVLNRYEKLLNDSANLTQERIRFISNRISVEGNLTSQQSSFLNNFATARQTNITNPPNQPNQPNQPDPTAPAKKGFTEIATRLFVFQSAISFVSGAMSGLGPNFEKFGEALSDGGQAILAYTQIGSLAQTVRGEKKENENGFLAAGGTGRSLAAAGINVAGGLYVLIQAISAFDKAIMVLNGTIRRSQAFTDDLDISMLKYNIQLSDQSKRIAENLSSAGNVSGSGISATRVRSGFSLPTVGNRFKLAFGFEPSKESLANEEIGKFLSESGFANTTNQDITKRALGFYSQKIIAQSEGKKGSVEVGEESLTTFQEELRKLRAKVALDYVLSKGFVTEDPNTASFKRPIEIAQQNLKTTKEAPPDKGLPAKIKQSQEKLNTEYAKLNAYLREKPLSEDQQKPFQEGLKKLLNDLVIPVQNAVINEEKRKEGLLFSSELLEAQLTTYQQISKIQLSIPSSAERQLSLEKELLATTESRKMQLEQQTKSFSEQRQLTSDIKDSVLTLGRQRIDKYLKQVSGSLDVREGTKELIDNAYSKLAKAKTPTEASDLFGGVLEAIQLKEGATDKKTIDANNKIKLLLLEQLKSIKESSKVRQLQNAEEAMNLALAKEQNYLFTLRKDLFSSALSQQQRLLEVKQKELDLQNKINDSLFKATNINSENPNEDPFVSQRREDLRNISLPAERERQAFNIEKSKAEIADRQNIFNIATQKEASLEDLKKLSESKDLEESYKILTDIINKQGSNFTSSVQTAGNYFYQSMVGTAETVHKILTEEYVAENGLVYNKKDYLNFKSGESSEEGMPDPVKVDYFIDDVTKTLMKNFSPIGGETLTVKEVKKINPPQSGQLVNPEGSIQADTILRAAQFNQTIAKKYWELDKSRLENSITLAQRALEIEKQRTAEQLRLEQTQFEGRNLLEFNPLKQRINQANFQQESQIKAAQIEDEQNARNYLLEARKSALNYMISSGSTPDKITEVQSANSIEELKKALNEVAAQNVNKISAGDEFLKKVNDAGDIFINKMKEFYPTVKVEESEKDKFAKYSDTSMLPTDISELKTRKNFLLQNYESGESFGDPEKLRTSLQTITETLDLAIKNQQDRLKFASEGGYTNNLLPPVPYLKTPGVKKQTAAEISNVETQIENETSFSRGIQSAKGQIDYELMTFDQKMGKDIPINFRDGMASALKELSNPNSTEPLKNRLLGVASSFLQKINDGLMQNLANQMMKPLMSGFGSASLGQNVSGMASGGYIKGGSGSKDDVPAMLMGGEYVVTKSAVQKYGPAFLDSLNKGTIKKYADGGWVESDVTKYQDSASVSPYGQSRNKGLSFDASGSVVGMDSYTGTAENKEKALKTAQSNYYAQNAQTGQGGFYMPGENGMGAIMGQRNLLSFATQQTAGTKFDKISGSGNEASIDLGAGSSNMSLFGLRDQNNAKNAAYLESKQKSLDLYFGGIDAAKQKANREEEIRKDIERIKEEAKKQQKEMIKGILISMAASAATAGIVALGNAASAGWSATNQASGGTATFGEKFKGAFTGGTMGDQTRGGMFNAFSSSGYKDFSTVGAGALGQEGGGLYSWNKEAGGYSKMTEMDYNKMFPFGASYDSLGTPTALKNPNSSFRNPLMNKGNAPFYDRKASGGYVAGNGMGDNVPTMLNGGEFVISKQAAQNIGTNKLQQINSGKTGGDSSEAIIAKLDELVEKLSAVGTLNITVNSDSKGGQQSKEEGGNQDKQTKELARRIKEVVMVVLKDEKRLGGMLR